MEHDGRLWTRVRVAREVGGEIGCAMCVDVEVRCDWKGDETSQWDSVVDLGAGLVLSSLYVRTRSEWGVSRGLEVRCSSKAG